MNLGSDHLHLRERMYKNLEPYPHPRKLQRYYDKLMFIVGSFAPLALFPQVFHLFETHNTAGLSIATWVLLGTVNGMWAFYGVLHREYPIIIANAGMTILDFTIVLGIFLFR